MSPHTTRVQHSRRRFLQRLACTGLAMAGASGVLTACAQSKEQPAPPTTPALAGSPSTGPTAGRGWTPPAPHEGHIPKGTGTVEFPDRKQISFEAGDVNTVRPDVFQEGHFSLFDVLVHLDQKRDIKLAYHWDEELRTHVIDEIDGQGNWWYEAWYSAGWAEGNAYRMDTYPYKDKTRIRLRPTTTDRLDTIHATFRQELERLAHNDGQIILPSLTIHSPDRNWAFEDVSVAPHNVRSDLFKPGTVTALDALIGLAERKELPALELTWYDKIGSADPVDSYWVSRVGEAYASGGCGLVYESGSREFGGFRGAHIHIPADARPIVSPEYAFWFWICL